MVVGYINGSVQFSITDTGDDGLFNAADNIMHLFQDDTVTSGIEFATGEINQFRIYSGPLSPAEVLALGGPRAQGPQYVVTNLGTLGGDSSKAMALITPVTHRGIQDHGLSGFACVFIFRWYDE